MSEADPQSTTEEQPLEISGITLNGKMTQFQMKAPQSTGKVVVVAFTVDAQNLAPGSPVLAALAACYDETVSVTIKKTQLDLFSGEDDGQQGLPNNPPAQEDPPQAPGLN